MGTTDYKCFLLSVCDGPYALLTVKVTALPQRSNAPIVVLLTYGIKIMQEKITLSIYGLTLVRVGKEA
jgi:hypothetical protein